jgi:choline-sulfatase
MEFRKTTAMNRRGFLKRAGGSTLGAALVKAAPSQRPNILILMTDQQFADAMSCRMGGRYIKTPHMDSLAANGTLFTRAYCANPLCVPSRTSMFTGRYPSETGIQTNQAAELDVEQYPLMGRIFQRAGYLTGYFGKWHIPVPQARTELHGFDVWQRRSDDAGTAAKAVEFIKTRHNTPFLLVASFLNPHNICQWPRGEKLSEGDVGTPPPLEECPPQRLNHAMPRNETGIMGLMRRSFQSSRLFPVGGYDAKKWREYIWAYYRMIELVDGLIGQVCGAVREAGIEEHTLIVFTSDHGDCQGAHGWNQKTVFYEEAARVPFILSLKGTTKRGTANRLVQTGVDLIPTLCSYADIPVPKQLPGLSLKETANGKGAKDPRAYVVVSNRMVQGAAIDGRVFKPDGRMVRSQRYKYCVYSEGQRSESLVDMEEDPGEMMNLAGDPEYKQILDAHRAMLATWSSKINDNFSRVKA